MKEIRRAENAGFCFGVKQAIEKKQRNRIREKSIQWDR